MTYQRLEPEKRRPSLKEGLTFSKHENRGIDNKPVIIGGLKGHGLNKLLNLHFNND